MDFNLFSSRARGTVFIELFDDRPITRDNFLAYVNGGKYDNTLMHRLARGFVLQGGGWEAESDMYVDLPGTLYTALAPDRVDLDGNPNTSNPTIVNEYSNSPTRSNTAGTLAMAKLGGNPNSATSEFFFNISNNGGSPPNGLDYQNGGFTVFARVVGDGMSLINAYNSGLGALDLNFDTNGNGVHDSNVPPPAVPDQGAFGTVPALGAIDNHVPLVLLNADRIDYLGPGMTTDVDGGLTFATRDAFIDTGTLFTGTGGLTVGTGRSLGVRDGTTLASRTLWNQGTFEPGLQIGNVSVQSFRQDAGATLEIQLDGTTVDTGYDRLTVANLALLGGTLKVETLGFNPSANQSFTILSAGSISGRFSELELFQLRPGLVWDVDYTNTAVTLNIVMADFNRDGVVDSGDYVLWRKLNGTQASEPFARGDANGDGQINATDLAIMKRNFGNTSGGTFGSGGWTAVPEPASFLLLSLAACFFPRRRPR